MARLRRGLTFAWLILLANAGMAGEEMLKERALQRDRDAMKIPEFSWQGTVGTELVKVTLRKKLFPARYRYHFPGLEEGPKTMFSGHGGVPYTVFEEFSVQWGKKTISVPKTLYEDCYDPCFQKERGLGDPNGCIAVYWNDDGGSILIEMRGGNEAEFYKVFFLIMKDGRCSRFIS